MKNKNRNLGKLKFNKNIISNFSSNGVIGGGTSNVNPSNCETCTSNNPDLYCPATDTDIIVNPPRASMLGECPSMNPDVYCPDTKGDIKVYPPR